MCVCVCECCTVRVPTLGFMDASESVGIFRGGVLIPMEIEHFSLAMEPLPDFLMTHGDSF